MKPLKIHALTTRIGFGVLLGFWMIIASLIALSILSSIIFGIIVGITNLSREREKARVEQMEKDRIAMQMRAERNELFSAFIMPHWNRFEDKTIVEQFNTMLDTNAEDLLRLDYKNPSRLTVRDLEEIVKDLPEYQKKYQKSKTNVWCYMVARQTPQWPKQKTNAVWNFGR